MAEKPLPSFRSIAAPIDADDATLDSINAKLGVPILTKPTSADKPARQLKSADSAAPIHDAAQAPIEKLTIELPDYLADALRRTALDRKSSARHVIMAALQKDGFKIAAVDLVPDGRRARRRSQ